MSSADHISVIIEVVCNDEDNNKEGLSHFNDDNNDDNDDDRINLTVEQLPMWGLQSSKGYSQSEGYS